ncbi:hypothetical protein B0H63DRAFT_197295 [Podospora didyma]|uniref:Zn(2)-C6 fungal-type domain-containing protein n=1 Tax=Podospora didyma TaxID=330526 RepID=A0AAE0TVK0_9PEZI|nr:hypothetical protein B0H63DRAFT_197295 [Podospora didyma]
MPISRKKACESCRSSKARCNRALPCSRCLERHLECAYERPQPFRYRQGQSLRAITCHVAPEFEELEENDLVDDGVLVSPRLTNWALNTVDMPTPATLDFSLFDSTPLWYETLPPMNPDAPSSVTPVTNAPESDISQEPPSHTQPRQWMKSLASLSMRQSMELTQSLSPETPKSLVLCRRKLANMEQYLTSKILFGQMTSYPIMMINKKGVLPPFIHPQCVLEGKSAQECIARGNGNHTCLSQPLAICASLLHMFFTRTPTSSPFVWQSIYQHQQQLFRESKSYGVQELIELLQTAVIYILIQTLDPESIQVNDTISLIRTTSGIGKRLHGLGGYQGYWIERPNDMSRQEWALRESARRTICLLYGIELVFDVMIGRTTSYCGGYTEVPLPSVRSLWDPVEDSTLWKNRYDADSLADSITGQQPHSIDLTIGDLMTLVPRHGMSTNSQGDHERGLRLVRLEKWCEELDDFGSLMWMAVMMRQPR